MNFCIEIERVGVTGASCKRCIFDGLDNVCTKPKRENFKVGEEELHNCVKSTPDSIEYYQFRSK